MVRDEQCYVINKKNEIDGGGGVKTAVWEDAELAPPHN